MNRRKFIKASTAIVGLSILNSCDKKEIVSNVAENSISISQFSSDRLHSSLNNLKDAYESIGVAVSKSLLAPVTEDELKARCSWFPGEITPELVSLYGWHEGQEKSAWEEKHPFMFRDNAFTRLRFAEEEYHSMMSSYGNIPEHHELLKNSFPFAAFDGAWYVLPTKGHPFNTGLKMPIISVHEGIEVYFYSMETMVNTCVEWVNHTDYKDDYTLPRKVELEIWDKHNPGIFQ